MLLIQQVNAVSRTRLLLGRNTENTQRTSAQRTREAADCQTRTSTKTKLTQFFALANRNAKAGVNPNPGTD